MLDKKFLPTSPFPLNIIHDVSRCSFSYQQFVVSFFLVFLPIENPQLDGAIGDIIIENGAIDPATTPQSASGFNFADSGDFQINAVPEATSLLIWLGLSTVVGVSKRRRQNAAC